MKTGISFKRTEDGIEVFDKKKRCILTENRGFITRYKYFGKRWLYSIDSENDEKWWRFNSKGKLTYHKDTFKKSEYWFKFDSKGRIKRQKTIIDGKVTDIMFNYNGDNTTLTLLHDNNTICIFDKNDRLIFRKRGKNKEWWTYDKNNKIIDYRQK